MAEQEVKRVDTETPVFPAPVESKSEVADDKAIVPPPPAAEEEEKVADGSKDLAVAESKFFIFVFIFLENNKKPEPIVIMS
ncbi:hypothetical protein OIU84_016071 [Salix udensis]|uniref:Remorin N-terminal domain-containing protein n=1 Tax=Salix udensis TaxID=889485 RepID=A0AAD6J8S2_9ROSI|nr:hypothetical protein OIU84_016071 [Salix udensis]